MKTKMFNISLNLLIFVYDILLAVSSYKSERFVWACVLSGFAGAMFVVTARELIRIRDSE